jgi:hypothetical protein
MTDKTAEEVRNYWTNIERETTRFTEEQSKKRYILHKEIAAMRDKVGQYKTHEEVLEAEIRSLRAEIRARGPLKTVTDDTMIRMYDAVVSQRDQLMEDLSEEREKTEALERGKGKLIDLHADQRENLKTAWARVSMLEREQGILCDHTHPSVCYACGRTK